MATKDQDAALQVAADEAMANLYAEKAEEHGDVLSEFLDFLRERYVLANYPEGRMFLASENPRSEQLLADFFEIDMEAVERHRRRVIEGMRAR